MTPSIPARSKNIRIDVIRPFGKELAFLSFAIRSAFNEFLPDRTPVAYTMLGPENVNE
jgi:hypothetical protein